MLVSSLQPPRVLIKSIYLDTARSTYAAVDILLRYVCVCECVWVCVCMCVYVCVCM